MIKIIIFFATYLLINQILIKTKYLIDKQQISDHKKKIFTKLNTPLSGGLFFVIIFTYFFFNQYQILTSTIIIIYLIGLLSDLDYLSSPIIRMILQIFFILTFVAINDLSIKTISVEILDELLNNKIINTLFILMCLLVLINGFNFLDGINCLTIGYFTIFLISIYYTSVRYNLLVDLVFLENLMIILSIILIFNFFGRSFLGDSGTYSIGFLVGIISIKYAFENYFQMSPYFIVSLLWYPALENLFSIIRRMYLKLSPAKPDNFHLHHLIYFFLKKKISNKKDNLFINSLAGILINVYILGLSLFATLYYNHTKTLVFIIIFNILVYLLTYTYLNNKLKTHNKNV